MIKTRDLPTLFKISTGILFSKTSPYFPIVASFDVTKNCTLKCKHCYWWEQEHNTELNDEAFYLKVLEIKKRHPTLVSAAWLGGEPLLRLKLVERCKSLFSFNRVITNGTLPLPDWKDVRFVCSVDGAKDFHEAQRGENTYQKIKKNLNRPELDINLFCVITKLNQSCLEEFVEEWSKTDIRSMGFGFYTPIEGKDNESLWLNFQERDKVIERLIRLKKQYSELINTSLSVLENFRSANCRLATERCRRDFAPFNAMCFDTAVKRKFPCVIGEKADCEKCGCIASVLGESIYQNKKDFLIETIQTEIWRHTRRSL
ncbi:MAG: radical SAM protein [bacterium]|nr:radical SAM protein [bacterium]